MGLGDSCDYCAINYLSNNTVIFKIIILLDFENTKQSNLDVSEFYNHSLKVKKTSR